MLDESNLMKNDCGIVPRGRLSRQLRNFLDPIVNKYYYHIVGDQFALNKVPESTTILDVGTGAGRYPYLLANGTRQIIGLDVSKEAVTMASKVTTDSNVSFCHADGVALPVADSTVELLLCIGVFNKIQKIKPFLSEFKRVLTDKGTLIFDVNNESTLIRHKRSPSFANFSITSLTDRLESTGFRMHAFDNRFFISRLQKKGILSERLPLTVRLLLLSGSILIDRILSHLPGVQQYGGHIWVQAQAINSLTTPETHRE